MVKIKSIICTWLQGCLIALVVILSVCPFSCKLSKEGIDIIEGDYISPKINDCFVIDSSHVGLDFTENVNLSSVSVSVCGENCSAGNELLCSGESFAANNKKLNCILANAEEFEKFFNKDFANNIITSNLENKENTLDNNAIDGSKIVVGFDCETEIGKSYVISGIVKDKVGNSLTFSAPFNGYNKNIPKMIITEVQSEYAKLTGKDKENLYRGEYVELLALESGNLYGLVIGSATNGKELDFHFPAINVKKGEIIIVHFRKKGDGCISETGDNLSLAFAPHSVKGIRDLWLDNNGSAFSDYYDAIYLKDIINNQYYDGFMYINTKKKSQWSEEILEVIDELVNAGIFKSSDVSEACVEAVSPTKSFIRLNVREIFKEAGNIKGRGETIPVPFIKFCKDDWIIQKAEDNIGKI